MATTSHNTTPAPARILNWERADIEQRLGFKGAAHTDANAWLALFVGILLGALFYGGVWLDTTTERFHHAIYTYFYERGPTQQAVILLSGWALAILFFKWRKLALQQRALELSVTPDAPDFAVTPVTAPAVIERMREAVDHPRHFVLLNRIERALSNLKNIGVISDVSEIMKSQAENDEDRMETSYALVKSFVWAIPVLGFIGTVVGLSQAINQFGDVLASADAMGQLKQSLQGVTRGLYTAFDTTSLALVAALGIQLTMTSLKRNEELFLDACKEYCHAHIIARLRLIPTEDGARKQA